MPVPILHRSLKITSPFGSRKIQGVEEYHKGLDLAANYESLYAPETCNVVRRDYDDLSGGYITVKLVNGYKLSFCHLDAQWVDVGDICAEGEEIGVTGETGRSFGAHLHITMFDPNDNRIDPTKYIQSLWSNTIIPQLSGFNPFLIIAVIVGAIILTGVLK